MRNFSLIAVLVASTCIVAASAPAQAQQASFNIPAGSLKSALDAYGRQSGRPIVYKADEIRGVRSAGYRGAASPEQVLEAILSNTGFTTRSGASGSVAVVRLGNGQTAAGDPSSGAAGTKSADDREIVVTGTRIRGASVASPQIEVTGKQVRDAGFNDLGQVVRSIPQNFSGGQNPGVAPGTGGIDNQNITGGSSLNLRGLGPDATLTLLNGRRLSYDGFVQAVDVSVVPIAALDRIEIIPDGASAIYGSDAVAGVANIILKRDYNGVEAAARYGLATQGGGAERELSLTGGHSWKSGGFIAAYTFLDADTIRSHDRDYTDYLSADTTLYPKRKQHSAILSLHQDLSPSIELSVDALYTRRQNRSSLFLFGSTFGDEPKTTTYLVSPSLRFRLPSDWSLTASGTYGRDYSKSHQFIVGVFDSRGCSCNTSYSAELSGEGPVIALPGGDARAAVGIGWRRSDFEQLNYVTGSRNGGDRTSRYAFGELYLPFIGPQQEIAGVNRLSLTAALRYEKYNRLGEVVTPRVGVIYEPTKDFALKASWGKSFKAPTLLQENQPRFVYLYPAAPLGAAGFPPNATVLVPYGGNTNLEPERARTWSATLSLHPQALAGFRAEVAYFNVDYRNRVVQPIFNLAQAFSDPAYAPFITPNPTPAEQAALIAMSPTGVTNFTTAPYDPANVIGIASNVYTNAARATAKGVDASVSYAFKVWGGDATVSGSAALLDGKRRNSPTAADFVTVGRVFNPAKFNARAGIVWDNDRLTLASFVNYTGSVLNNVTIVPPERTGDFTTVDLNIAYRFRTGSNPEPDLDLTLTVRNLLDKDPPLISPFDPFSFNYDSTNYSAIGRFVTFSVRKRW